MKRPVLESMLGGQFILYGEWLYAKHSVHYRKLPHYFFEFDIYDKEAGHFLDLESRLVLLQGTGIHTVPLLYRGVLTVDQLPSLIGRSAFGISQPKLSDPAPREAWSATVARWPGSRQRG